MNQKQHPATDEVKQAVVKAFAALRKQGILARADFTCCQTCAYAEFDEKVNKAVEQGKAPKGIVFYHHQDRQGLEQSGTLHLAFSDTGRPDCALSTQQVGALLAHEMKAQGLKVTWDGSPDTRIEVGRFKDQFCADCEKYLDSWSRWSRPVTSVDGKVRCQRCDDRQPKALPLIFTTNDVQ